MFAPANRLKNLPPYAFAVIGQRIRQMTQEGIDVIRLDIGSPDQPPPPAVIESLTHSANQPGNHGYSGYQGTPAFRRAIARYYERRFEVILDVEKEVLPLVGSKEGIVNLGLALLNEGDIVLVPDIGYPSYSMGARLADAEVYWLPLREESGYLPDLSIIPADIASRAKILWINYPNNPTGAVAELSHYQEMVNFCRANHILLASDNPYVEVTFDGYRADSVLQAENAKDIAVEFMSFSKSYNMGGWRLGAAVGNAEVLKMLLQVKSNVDSGHFLAVYDAGITALEYTTPEWEYTRNLIYQKRRNRVLEVLPSIGLHARKSQGSIYVWARVEKGDGMDYANAALDEAHVSIAPGGIYGPGGEDYVRISLGVLDDHLQTALERLQVWYAKCS